MFIFYFYWEHTSKREANKIREEVKLASDTTIEVKGVSSKIDEDIIYQFFSDYGLIQEVAPVRNYSGMISLSKEIYELSLEIKEINLRSSKKSKEKDEKAIEERE
jgi:RNA recognition motif-containing protein